MKAGLGNYMFYEPASYNHPVKYSSFRFLIFLK